MGIKRRYRSLHRTTVHSTTYYLVVHGTIVLAELVIMGLMGWIMSPDTQGQLTGGDDATGNMPGLTFLMAFFSWINSIAVIALWLVEAYNAPLLRASIQACVLLPANATVGLLLAYQNNWTVFLGKCISGSILCKSVWKTLVRVEGVAVFLIGLAVILTVVDLVASTRMWHKQRTAFKNLVVLTSERRYSAYPAWNTPPSPM